MTTPPATTTATGTAGKPAATGTAGTGTTATTPPTTSAAGGAKATTPPPTASGTAGASTTTTTPPPATAGGSAGSSAAAGGSATAGSGTTMATGGTSAAAGGSAAAGSSSAPTVEGFPAEASCLQDDPDLSKDGPFKYMATSEGAVKMWVPMLPAGCKTAVIHLANGTGATCSAYQGSLNRMASHGFISTCYEDPNTGAGTQGVMALDTVLKKYPDMTLKRLGSTGHSQGGQAAFTVLQLAEAKWGFDDTIYAGLAMEPASGFGTQPSGGSWQSVYKKIKSPMFMFSGTADMLVSQAWVQQGFDALDKSIEAYHWSAIGATHIPTPDPQEMEISVPWFRWKLLGDKKACEFFKKMPDGGKWKVIKEQNAKPCE